MFSGFTPLNPKTYFTKVINVFLVVRDHHLKATHPIEHIAAVNILSLYVVVN